MYRSVVFVVLAAALGSATAADQPLEMEASLKPKLLALLPESRPPKPIARTLQTEEWQFKGRFGKKLVHSRSLYVPQEAGLVRLEDANSMRGWRDVLVVCGLIALQSSGSSQVEGLVTNETSTRLTGFEASSAGICRPSPGAEFSYRFEAERRYDVRDNMTGLFGRKGTRLETFDVLCKADAAYLPASEIFRSLEGNALPVRCEQKSDAAAITFEYAFLPESGVYLRLRDRSAAHQTELRYMEIRYRD